MTDEQMRDLVKDCGLDWQRGFMPLFDGDPTNRYAVLIESVEAAERERCAKLCERIASADGLEWPGKPKTYFCDDGTGCAGAIRMDGL